MDRSSNGGINALATLEHQRRKALYLISVGAAAYGVRLSASNKPFDHHFSKGRGNQPP